EHHVAQHLANVTPRQRVVADVSYALGRQMIVRDSQNHVANWFGNPRINSVRDDVIELAELGANLHDVGRLQFQVLQAYLPGGFAAPEDRSLCKIEADKVTAGKRERHRNQIPAVAASNLKHAATVDGRGLHAEERRNGCEPVRVSLIVRQSPIKDLVVACWHLRLNASLEDQHAAPASLQVSRDSL